MYTSFDYRNDKEESRVKEYTKTTRAKSEMNLFPCQAEWSQVIQEEFSGSLEAERGRTRYEAKEGIYST